MQKVVGSSPIIRLLTSRPAEYPGPTPQHFALLADAERPEAIDEALVALQAMRERPADSLVALRDRVAPRP